MQKRVCSALVMTAGSNPPPTAPRPFFSRSREAVLLGSVLLLLGFFAVTAFASRMYHKSVHMLADQWFASGESAFQSRNYKEAVTDFRNALIYSPNNTAFQFRLAQALSASGHGEQAQTYLLNLYAESPGSGPINLELARIAARSKNDMADALRYYHGAIYGVWDQDPLIMRWEVRRELSEFLLARGASRQAVPELIALTDNVPPNDLARSRQAAEFLLRGQLWLRALAMFQSILAAEHNEHESGGDRGHTQGLDTDALAGAGTAAFHLGEYPQTVEYLEKVPAENRSDSQSDMLETSRRVIALDPFFTTLSSHSRAAIAAGDLELAKSHAQNCVLQHTALPIERSTTPQALNQKPQSDQVRDQKAAQKPPAPSSLNAATAAALSDPQRLIAEADSMKPAWTERMLEHFPERVNDAMSLAFQLENATVTACGPLSGPDRALWLLGLARAASAASETTGAASAPPNSTPPITTGAPR
jgi:tetratricopeptide (TPR) repeat protein